MGNRRNHKIGLERIEVKIYHKFRVKYEAIIEKIRKDT